MKITTGFGRRARVWSRGLVAASFWLVALQSAYSIAATVTLEPVADAYVLDGVWADSNFGSANPIFTQTRTTTGNYDSYLKFDTASAGGAGSVAAATLRISASKSGPGVGMAAYAVADSSWAEAAITWNTKPARGAALGSVTVAGVTYVYYEFDVSSYVIGEKAAGRNLLSFALHNPEVSSQAIYILSREATSGRPQLVITLNEAPTVALTSPANGAVFTAPATISVAANAADADGTVSQVQFFANGSPIGTDTSTPYSIEWSNVAAGSYSLTAVATDNLGLATTSAPVAITVNAPPTVSLTSPANNATFTAPADITITADAQDSDGTISQVEFFEGANLIATRTTPPYSIVWTGVPAGSYSLTARATDNRGASTTSAAVGVTVNTGAATMYFIHPDHLNTPRVITNQVGQTVWRYDNNDPFGGNVPDENPSGLGTFTCNLRFPGQYFDKETNLHYNMARDYDPAIGRYIQPDGIGILTALIPIPGGPLNHLYAYVDSNPLSHVDPDGYLKLPDWLMNWGTKQGVAGGAGGVLGGHCARIVCKQKAGAPANETDATETCLNLMNKTGTHRNPDYNRIFFTCKDTCILLSKDCKAMPVSLIQPITMVACR